MAAVEVNDGLSEATKANQIMTQQVNFSPSLVRDASSWKCAVEQPRLRTKNTTSSVSV